MFSVILTQKEDLAGSTLILPAVSVGNVGQLAVDLLVNSLTTTKIGYVKTAYIQPIVGNEAYACGKDASKGKLSTACEIYKCTDQPVIFIQQRAPIVSGCAVEFRTALRQWIKTQNFERVVLLSSSFAHHRSDRQIANPTCRFVSGSGLTQLRDKLVSELNWTELEEDIESDISDAAHAEARRNIPGSGITSHFIKECEEDGIPLVVLLKFCFEGDNVPDAVEIVSYLNSWLQLKKTTAKNGGTHWTYPESWLLLFGSSAPISIF